MRCPHRRQREDLPRPSWAICRPVRRFIALAVPLAAAAALALWFTGPLAPGRGPVGSAADLAGGIELTENTLGLAASDVFAWEVPSDAFLEVAKLDPLADVPSFGCTYEDDLGCLLLSPTAETGRTRGPAPQRILT
jgi:hypothetical protein